MNDEGRGSDTPLDQKVESTLVGTAVQNLRRQNTIAGEARVSGFGYWNGQDVNVHFRPAAPNSGITFVRSDLPRPLRIGATVSNRIEVPRRTVLSAGGVNVEMVEHVMAALAGLQIDNCDVWVSGPELPGCDGSCLPFVDALRSAGIQPQEARRARLVVTEKTRVAEGDAWIEARPLPAGSDPTMHLQYRLDYGINHIIGRQTYRSSFAPEHFRREIAPARTFLLKEEADWLRKQGLGKRTTYQDLLVFADPEGLIDNELRFEDECVRHKTLDLIGDLALSGCDLIGQFVAYRSGHRLNASLARALLSEGRIIDAYRASA